MRSRSKHAVAAVAATLLLSVAVSSASANRISASNGKFRVTWAALRLGNESIEVVCPVTLEGSFHSATIRKVTGALIGAITRAIIPGEPPCTGGRVTALQESLPYHLTYQGFSGTLPNITNVEFLYRRYAFLIEVTVSGMRATCLYKDRGRVEENLVATISRNTVTGEMTTLTPSPERHVGLFSGGFLCPVFGSYSGAGQTFLLGTTTRISVTLI
jgi:hypothetical protein